MYLGALEAPKDEPTAAKKQPDDFDINLDNDEIDADDPDFVDFLQKLGSAGL